MQQTLVSGLVVGVIAVSTWAQPLEVAADKPFVPTERVLAGLVITLDAGDGGASHSDGYLPHASGSGDSVRGVKSGQVEDDLNMLVAAQLWHYLRKAGAVVHMTRWDDRKVTFSDTGRGEELAARLKTAVESSSHLFISLHHTWVQRQSADSVLVTIWPTDSAGRDQPLERALATCLGEEVQATVHHAEAFKQRLNQHPLVADSDIPSAIIAFGYLSNPAFDAWVSQRGRHRDEARGAYNAIVRMWREHRAELEELRARLFPREAADAGTRKSSTSDDSHAARSHAETRPAIPEEGEEAENRPASQPWASDIESARRRTGLHRVLWRLDRPPATATEIQWIIDQYCQRVLSDVTFFYLKTEVEKDDRGWHIRATTNDRRMVKAVERILSQLRCGRLRFDVNALPTARLGEKRFGVVQIPMAMLRARPVETAPVDSQLLLGERVFLLDENEDGTYLLLHAADSYIGWVRRDAILRLDETGFAEWENARLATLRRDYLVDDFRLPAGSRLPVLPDGGGHADSAGENNDLVKLRLPKGIRATGGQCVAGVPLEFLRLPPDCPAGRLAAEAAIEYLTTPYVFGGRSRLGIDCSGLAGAAYATVGLTMPRDARQQVLVGQLVATPWHFKTLQPGDQIFFCDETHRVSHTGLSLGGMRFIHASGPEVQVSSLDPTDPLYSEYWRERFAFARRPLP